MEPLHLHSGSVLVPSRAQHDICLYDCAVSAPGLHNGSEQAYSCTPALRKLRSCLRQHRPGVERSYMLAWAGGTEESHCSEKDQTECEATCWWQVGLYRDFPGHGHSALTGVKHAMRYAILAETAALIVKDHSVNYPR